MRMFITSKNKYLSNDMKLFGTCSISLTKRIKSIASLVLCKPLQIVYGIQRRSMHLY